MRWKVHTLVPTQDFFSHKIFVEMNLRDHLAVEFVHYKSASKIMKFFLKVLFQTF